MMNSDNIVCQVTNDRGVPFNVRVVRKGERYGLKDCLVHDKDDALVEFYDARYTEGFGPRGQFVSRYYWTTLTGEDRWSRGDYRSGMSGLCLYGGVTDWQVTGNNLYNALAAVEAVLKGGK